MEATLTAPLPRPKTPNVVWQSLRPFSLTVSVFPALVGTAVAVTAHQANLLIAGCCLLVAILLQAGTNVSNDAEDALTGADNQPNSAPSLAIKHGWITPAQARIISLSCFVMAAAIGIPLTLIIGKPGLLGLGIAAIAVGWFYTAPPIRLAYRPLGELASGIPMGIGIAWGTAAAQVSHVPNTIWWASIPLAFLISAILHGNNARDRATDPLVGKHTLATYLSPNLVIWEYRLLLIGSGATIALGLIVHGLPVPCAIALIPGALSVAAAFSVKENIDIEGWMKQLFNCIKLVNLTSVTLAAGLIISRFT